SRAFAKAVFTDRHEELAELLDDIRTVGGRHGNAYMLMTADGIEAMGCMRRGELHEARPALERLLAGAREHADPFGETLSAMSLADVELSEGRMEAARHVLAESRVRLEHSARGRMESMDL